MHAVAGIILVGLGFYQVRSGIQTEWPMTTGRPDYMAGAQTLWYIWAVVSLKNQLCSDKLITFTVAPPDSILRWAIATS